MARKRKSRGGKKTAGRRKPPVKSRTLPRGKARRSRKKGKKKPSRRTTARTRRRFGRRPSSSLITGAMARGLGPEAAGQSGDTEGLSRAEVADSESVEELIEEGQAFEAGVISGVENAPDADRGGVRTREVPEDDVPLEYLDEE